MRVALLRGINVGGHRKVSMAELRAGCTAAGLESVSTYIQSGNVVFDGGPAAEADSVELIAGVVEARFGFAVPVVVRTVDELLASLAAHPFDPLDGGEKMLHILFCDATPPPNAVDELDPDRSLHDRWEVIGRDIHVRYGKGSGTSKATVDWFEKQLCVRATSRNLVTVRALIELAS